MTHRATVGEALSARGVSRRNLVKFCAAMASLLALPADMRQVFAQALAQAQRPSVIWLPFQECTGCTESLTRSSQPSVESLLFDLVSLDYQETLMAASGHQAEEIRLNTMKANKGKYILIIDGSVATGEGGAYSASAARRTSSGCVTRPKTR